MSLLLCQQQGFELNQLPSVSSGHIGHWSHQLVSQSPSRRKNKSKGMKIVKHIRGNIYSISKYQKLFFFKWQHQAKYLNLHTSLCYSNFSVDISNILNLVIVVLFLVMLLALCCQLFSFFWKEKKRKNSCSFDQTLKLFEVCGDFFHFSLLLFTFSSVKSPENLSTFL